jgi:DNA-binding NarL/FixJ family response regulator
MANIFTQRELEILKHLASGKQNKGIARELGISPFTVRDHLTSIYKKTGVSTRFELGLLAVRGGCDINGLEALKFLQEFL